MQKVSIPFWSLIVFVGVLLLLSNPVSPQHCAAATVWSDNFNDGNLSGWTTLEGSFSAANNYLEATEDDSMISHSSTTATGTWSFDVISREHWVMVEFICLEYGTIWTPQNGYYISISTVYHLQLEVTREGAWANLMTSSLPLSSTFHVDITRNSTGHFNVFVDEELRMSAQDDTHSSSTYFVVSVAGMGDAIDNIVVSNTIDIQPPPDTEPDTETDTPPTDTTPQIPGFPIASIALGAVAAVGTLILLRRRRH